MQIYQVKVGYTKEHVLDPHKGLVLRSREELQPSDTCGITYEGVEYTVDTDGTFEVPTEVGEYFLKDKSWCAGPNPFHKPKPTRSRAKTA